MMNNPNLFPISVYFGKPEHAAKLKDVGVNVYLQAERDYNTMKAITDTGMLVIAHEEWSSASVGNDPRVVGWNSSDECEMGLGCGGDYELNSPNPYTAYKKTVDMLRAKNDGRFVWANFGKGILDTWWSPGMMDDFIGYVDGSSADNYAYTSPGVRHSIKESSSWPAGVDPKRAAAYGWQADMLQKLSPAGVQHPRWVFVESARPYINESGAGTITPAQMEGAEWSSIIHEARGIAIFQHNNDPQFGGYSLVDIPEARKALIRAAHAKIASLAPVLNTQSYVWDFQAGVDTMLKVKDGSAYIAAAPGLKTTLGAKTFTLPTGVTGTTVEVVGENRTLQVSGGKFTDTFAQEYSHHVYKVAL